MQTNKLLAKSVSLLLALGLVAATAFDVSAAWSHLLEKSKPRVMVGPTSFTASFAF